MYHRDWYDGIGDAVPAGKNAKSKGRGLFATFGAVALCVMACYVSEGIFAAGGLSSDAPGASTPLLPSEPDEGGASFVMSWVYEDEAGADYSDGDGAAETARDEEIREQAEKYIASHMPDGGGGGA